MEIKVFVRFTEIATSFPFMPSRTIHPEINQLGLEASRYVNDKTKEVVGISPLAMISSDRICPANHIEPFLSASLCFIAIVQRDQLRQCFSNLTKLGANRRCEFLPMPPVLFLPTQEVYPWLSGHSLKIKVSFYQLILCVHYSQEKGGLRW
jgi:hypothetical protein